MCFRAFGNDEYRDMPLWQTLASGVTPKLTYELVDLRNTSLGCTGALVIFGAELGFLALAAASLVEAVVRVPLALIGLALYATWGGCNNNNESGRICLTLAFSPLFVLDNFARSVSLLALNLIAPCRESPYINYAQLDCCNFAECL